MSSAAATALAAFNANNAAIVASEWCIATCIGPQTGVGMKADITKLDARSLEYACANSDLVKTSLTTCAAQCNNNNITDSQKEKLNTTISLLADYCQAAAAPSKTTTSAPVTTTSQTTSYIPATTTAIRPVTTVLSGASEMSIACAAAGVVALFHLL
ncbi:hypothetical protein BDR26DRAFT_864592 [Obelidium mucronatum]|nr:hypothetical protein BDR26DRAFT_864592 [Obelidium mucronatum]